MTEQVAVYQPVPYPGQEVVLDHVLKDCDVNDPIDMEIRNDLVERAEFGKKKHGTYLMTHNGRTALLDAYQEALDAVMYLKQETLELHGKNRDVNVTYRRALMLVRQLAVLLKTPPF